MKRKDDEAAIPIEAQYKEQKTNCQKNEDKYDNYKG